MALPSQNDVHSNMAGRNIFTTYNSFSSALSNRQFPAREIMIYGVPFKGASFLSWRFGIPGVAFLLPAILPANIVPFLEQEAEHIYSDIYLYSAKSGYIF